MKTMVSIGVVCLARTTFDCELAEEVFKGIKKKLRAFKTLRWEITDKLLIEPEETEEEAKKLAALDLDGLMIISGTFHLGHLALILQNKVKVPVLFWAPDEAPYDGGKIRLNSVCGVNLNASNFYKSGIDNYICHVSDDPPEKWIKAICMKAALCRAKVGIAGYHANGFFNLSVDDLKLYQKFGILVDHYEISDIYSGYVEECNEAIKKEDITSCYKCDEVSKVQVDAVLRLARCFKAFMDKNQLSGLAVRCWPEFAQNFGIAPCAAMSYLQSLGYILGCEGDIEGTLSCIACSAISIDVPFMADLSQVNYENDFALMWHCGVASPTLWDKKSELALDTYFSGGKGVTADFVLKEGDVTIFRLDTARGKTRAYIEKGVAIPMEKQLKGTYAKVKFDRPVKEVFATVTNNGIAHHVAMIYGDYYEELNMLARILGCEVVR